MSMKKKLFASILSLLVIAALVLPAAGSAPQPTKTRSVSGLSMFQAPKFKAHYRTPRDVDIQRILEEAQVIPPGASRDMLESAIQQFKQEWLKRNPDTPSPAKLKELLEKEQAGAEADQAALETVTPESPIKSLVVPVEFPNETTFDWCGETVTMAGPLHNQIAPPGKRDNNTVWYEDTNPELYDELYFGVGPDAGVIINHPNLGPVDLRGYTMANYYLEQSEGRFLPVGLIYPKWLQAQYAEGYYGQDSCDGFDSSVYAGELVIEVVEAIKVDDPSFPWQDFDGDGNGIVDNFTVIHAGMGQEAGGGAQGDFSIWSHASLIGWPTGHLACAAGSVGCPDRDIYVREYSMDPENIDIGVIAEEFGHAAFGLPDLYQTDYQGSVAFWAIMESGSWNGILGGMQPAPFPLWFRYLIGWSQPAEVDYTTALAEFKVGQHSLRPPGTEQGIKINLPDKAVVIPNPLNSGQAWWSDKGDLLTNSIVHEFDLTGAAAPIFSFNSHWSMEVDWDGGYVEVSTDGGATWTALPDMDGFFTQNRLNGNNAALNWVLTGEGAGLLRFDLSAYAGQVILLRLNYVTDLAVIWDGWWADDITLADGANTLFFDDVETGGVGWTTETWQVVPLTKTYPRYYLAEWRNQSGFDRGLAYAYETVYADDDEWQVERVPYTMPGMLLYFRDGSYAFDYTLSDSWYDPPSYGPKHGLLVVDSHPFPYFWADVQYPAGAKKVRLDNRVQAADAPFTLQDTTPFTIHRGFNPLNGKYLDNPMGAKTFGPRPAVSQFHDSLGYYPGLWAHQVSGSLKFWDIAASAVIPAQGNYTTRITTRDNLPYNELYGVDLGDTVLGSGNPGDDGVQFGLHLAVVDKAVDGTWGVIQVWNSPALLDLQMTADKTTAQPGEVIKFALKVVNKTSVVQKFVLHNSLPPYVTVQNGGSFYNAATNSITWDYWVPVNSSRAIFFSVKVNPGAPAGAVLLSEARLADDALGDAASVPITIR
jgi:immune inhibitor A